MNAVAAPGASDGDASESPSDRWSGSVRTVVRQHSAEPVPVTELVDAMLGLHGADYLRDWSTVLPSWPTDLLSQAADRWMSELDDLVTGTQLFGRVAIVGWCLLDDRVAAEAERVGLLAGVANAVTPRLADFLTPEGVRLLRRRAPLVALTVGEAPPPVDLPSYRVTGAALGRPPASAPRAIGRWAVSIGADVVVGRGSASQVVEPPSVFGPELLRSAASAEPQSRAAAEPVAMCWSRKDVLHLLPAGGGLLRFDPRSDRWDVDEEWPTPASAAAGEAGVVVTPSERAAGAVLWGVTDGGGPVPLTPPATVRPGSPVAIAGDRVAVLGDRLVIGGPDREWVDAGVGRTNPDDSALLAASDSGAIQVGPMAALKLIDWDGTAHALLGPRVADVRATAGSERLVALAENQVVTLFDGTAVVGRWQTPSDEAVTALALSPDSRALLVATQHADPQHDPPARLRFWRLDRVPEVRLTEYTADTADGDDLLGIQPTVDALAAIVSAKAVVPPLSVGLFGAWGSGKSFFMNRVAARVVQLSAEAHDSGRSQESLWAWRNIRQIRFNAWHYAAADVWAGILEHLVKELARPAETGSLTLTLPAELSALERQRVTELAGAVDRAKASDAALEAAQRALDTAQHEASAKATDLKAAITSAATARTKAAERLLTAEMRAQLDELCRAGGLTGFGNSLQSTVQDIGEARASLLSAAGLVRTGDQRRLAQALLVVLGVGIGLTVLLRLLNVDLAGAIGTLTALVGCVGAVARWVAASAARVHDRLQSLDEAEREARGLISGIEAEVRAAKQAVRAAEVELAAAQHSRQEAAQEVDMARARVDAVGPGELLQEYLEGRNTAEDYRRQLGLIGTVHRDLQVISDAIVASNDAAADDPERPLDDVVNRIVLYVDDLDRCPPTVVVKVLEAVSMLMTFPMFVVVVAVDAHWISKSLAAVYPRLLTGRDVTPDNYLEKIFQLPVWLERPSDEAAASMARTLLTGGLRQTGAVGRRDDNDGEGGSAAGRSASQGAGSTATAGTGVRGGQPAANADVSLATTAPAAVTLDDAEVTAIETLAPLIARSPRALKRYLNTYRVLKALIEPDDLEPARLLLGVATGRPDAGERLLAEILAAPADLTVAELVKHWPAEDAAWLRDSLPTHLSAWPKSTCGPLKPVAQQVRRFVFHAQHAAPAAEAATPARHAPGALAGTDGRDAPGTDESATGSPDGG